ncbi:MAG TPA: zf-HC2 domain-containing protein [Pyrinomonadaceae bacterium]|nr:zf-HC2 domain-containing protein [Pyrinomonadaceae bacterium]
MNCDDCTALITALMENDLDQARAESVRMHLALCVECARACEELAMIVDTVTSDCEDLLPENQSKQIWCRINNMIESEHKPLSQSPVPEPKKRGLWHLSFWQLTSGLACIALVSSLLTVVAIRNYYEPSATEPLAKTTSRGVIDRMMMTVGLAETPEQQLEKRIRDRQSAIDYWNARVQQRRQQWDATTRAAFDRNLREIDESVNEYRMILQRDPDDDLSVEMLDSVLNEKTELLRDFSDL